MYKVVITDNPPATLDRDNAIFQPLGATVTAARCKTVEEVIALAHDADAIIAGFAPINATVIAALKQARVIVRLGIGYDSVDVAAAAKARVPVCNVPDYCLNEVADHTLALILATTRAIVPHAVDVRAGHWRLAAPVESMRTLRDVTVGLVGFGRIGREVAARLRPFRGRILVHDPVVAPAVIREAGFEPATLDGLLAQSDFVSLHCPNTPQTRGLINRETLARCKRGAILVNASRGGLVNTADLVEALRSGHLGGAALDVVDPEPIPKDSPLLAMPNVILTPHAAATSVKAEENLRTTAAQIAARALRGEPLINVVNGVA
ncbi:MAG TPA: C-terminal binding protein [Gemmatimonadaceae bacterium]|nr:C-terminal binding protein [Gemmatimonadaceae bacterium]